MVGFIRCEILYTVGSVGGIAISYVRRRHVGVVAKGKECLAIDPSNLELGAAAERDRLVGLVFVVVTGRDVVEVCFVMGFGVILFGGG